VVDFGQEADFRGCHWVITGEEQLELEYTIFIQEGRRRGGRGWRGRRD